MDSSSSTRFPTPSAATSPSDIIKNEIAQRVCQFLYIGDIGRLMQVDSARYESIREQITDIGISAIDRDLCEGNTKDAFQRIHELSSWLGGCHFVGPEENEILAWRNVLQRIPDARFELKQQSQLLRNLMTSAWQRSDTKDFQLHALTDVLIDIFVQAEKAIGRLGREFSLKFGNLESGNLAEKHGEKMVIYASIVASGKKPLHIDHFASRLAAMSMLRIKVNFLSTSLPDRLKAYDRNLIDIGESHLSLPRSTVVHLVWNVVQVFMTFDEETQSSREESMENLLDVTSLSMQDLVTGSMLGGIDRAADALESFEDSSCSLM